MPRLDVVRKLGLGSFVATLSFAGGLATALAPSAAYASAPAAELVGPAQVLSSPLRAAGDLQVNERTVAPDAQGRYLVVVRFEEPSLAAYRGGVPGLAATSPRARGESRLSVNSPQSRAYLSYLEQRQTQHLAQIASALGRSAQVQHRFLNVLNAVSFRASLDEAAKLQTL